MKAEIKEILDRLDYNEWEVDLYKVPITWCELYDIRDYITNLQTIEQQYSAILSENAELENKITNLQEENKRLKKIIKENTILVKDENGNYQECNINPLDYKARNEKAIEYIKENEKEYGSLEDNEKIILGLLQGSDE